MIEESLAALDKIYLKLPLLDCKGKCQGACGPIPLSALEWDRIVAHIGHEPIAQEEHRKTLRCPLLGADGRCTVYDLRPIICRLYGVAKGMRCEHGCRPHRWLTKGDTAPILKAVEKLSAGRPRRSPFPELTDWINRKFPT